MADEHLENREATPLVMKYEDLQVEIGTMAKLTPGVLASAPKGYLVHSSFSSCVVSKRTTETRERKKIDRTGNMAFLFFSLSSRKENRSRERLERKNSEGEKYRRRDHGQRDFLDSTKRIHIYLCRYRKRAGEPLAKIVP